MKKIQIFFLVFIVLFNACSKTEYNKDKKVPKPKDQVDLNVILRESTDFESLIQMFNLLTASEKYELWYEHLLDAKDQFFHEQDKVDMIDYLLSNMDSSIFIANSYENDVFTNYFVPIWIDSAKNFFSDLEIYDLTFDVTAEVIGEEETEEFMPPDDGPVNCFCHVGNTGYSCKKISIGFPSGITIQYGVCEQGHSSCNSSSLGCGFLWLQSCNGNHCSF